MSSPSFKLGETLLYASLVASTALPAPFIAESNALSDSFGTLTLSAPPPPPEPGPEPFPIAEAISLPSALISPSVKFRSAIFFPGEICVYKYS